MSFLPLFLRFFFTFFAIWNGWRTNRTVSSEIFRQDEIEIDEQHPLLEERSMETDRLLVDSRAVETDEDFSVFGSFKETRTVATETDESIEAKDETKSVGILATLAEFLTSIDAH